MKKEISLESLESMNFVHNGQNRWCKHFTCEGVKCGCMVERVPSPLNFISRKSRDKWIVSLSGMNKKSDCLTYEVRNIRELERRISEYKPNDKQLNRFIFIYLFIWGVIFFVLAIFALK